MRRFLILIFLCSASVVSAQEQGTQQIDNLDQLLQSVRQEQERQRSINKQRETAFLADKRAQQRLLAEAQREFEQQQKQNQPLLAVTDNNAREITRLENELETVVEDIGDLSSTFREFAGDFAAVFQESMLSVQLGERVAVVRELASTDTQVTIEEIQALWLLLQEDMTEAGKLTQFEAPVIDTAGVTRTTSVLRLGVFNAWEQGDYLRYVPETGELLALGRQPPARYRDAARAIATAQDGVFTLAVDPTRGNLLGMLSFTPDLRERIAQGGTIGLIIIALGSLGMLLTAWRVAYLLLVSRRIRRQLAMAASPSADNPLGRVLKSVEGIPIDQEELLQLKLDEAVLAEIPALERGNGLIKLLAATSPLLGLLGTVTGMILTFQAISLFGTGDPKLMAGGISQALVTTVLGLVVAIPLLFGHSVVAFLSRATVQRLDEQCAGVLARSAEGP
ncbi:MotA/TolQ/ExbB proton channel family protein [Pseudohalioglobus lutimaris]|uniref:MotA/TolQ/ExbB proton channel domain-containing protein n=1 Tax=Pseudohalioglobus lutimaris TaxID=1737061 RepID=A0A2N5X2R3_9GAMM|nr:MotA/TolQ/ExbB proton channel family protein [Pseudohalioglobus lutimaris]PLW68787.1 hypothetical protein C0039_10975 [Pseudohalioglobus lutimaris]